MKSVLPLLAFIMVLASCTTAYKTGQTPDDVYYSPACPQDEYVRVENKNSRRYEDGYDDEYYDDRYLRMKVRNRRVWSDLDFYYSNPYVYRPYNNYYHFNDSWNPYSYWNNYYNPYGSRIIVMNPQSRVYNRPRMQNLSVYETPQSGKSRMYGNRSYNNTYNNNNNTYRVNTNTNRDNGSDLRGVFGNSSNSSSRPSSNNSSNSNSSRSSNSSSSSSNAPARRF